MVGGRAEEEKNMYRLITAAFVATFLFVSMAASQDRKIFTVGTATATRGQKVTGTIEVPAGSDAALSIPVAVVHGAKSGPVLALVAGLTGLNTLRSSRSRS